MMNKKNIFKHFFWLWVFGTCLLSTGCLRVMSETMGSALSKGSYTSQAGDYFFYGSRLAGSTLMTPLAPIGIVDFPFELAIDLFILPFQCLDAADMQRRRQKRISNMDAINIAREGLMSEFKLRLSTMDTLQRCSLAEWLAYGEADRNSRMLRFIRVICEYEPMCFECLLNSTRCLYHSHYDVYQYLFRHGFSARGVSREYAVFYALVASYGNPNKRQMKMLKLLIENGCNPNATPPPWSAEEQESKEMTPVDMSLKSFWSVSAHEQYKGKTPLDIAIDQLDYSRKQLEQYPSSHNARYEMSYAEKVVELLRKHGAKTSMEMKKYSQ